MIPKVTLYDIYRETFRRSTLISIPNLSQLLVVPGSAFTEWEVFYSIVRDALKVYEKYYPLAIQQRIYIEVDNTTRKARINGNFEAYLKGIISEDQIVLQPAAIVAMSMSFWTSSTYPLRNFRYENGEITDCWYSSGSYYMSTICKRPFIEEYEEASHKPTSNCAVYFLEKDVNSQYTIFADEVYLSVCRYFMNIKKNMMLQNMPIELFQGLEEDFNRLEPKQQQIYDQALPASYFIL